MDPEKLPAGPAYAQKVAIPRLRRESADKGPLERHRVSRACIPCRTRKVKCSGESPRCKNCEEGSAICTYALSRKDRLKDLSDQNHKLVQALKDVRLGLIDGERRKVDQVLSETEGDDFSSTADSPSTLGKRPREDMLFDKDTPIFPPPKGSIDDLDLLDEDLLRTPDSRATGFVGHNSEIQWLRSLASRMKASDSSAFEPTHGRPGSGSEASSHNNPLHPGAVFAEPTSVPYVTDSTFYLDNDSIELGWAVEPFELPLPDTADRLFNCYMETVHSSFPLITKSFHDHFRKYNASIRQDRPFQVPQKWQATLNMVFAIGAKYSHLIEADWQEDEKDHLVYMTRAVRILGFKDIEMITSPPDLSSIQITGLLSFYYLTIGQVNRAWVMVGISIRFALSVGLHLRNEVASVPAPKRELLGRLFWSLRSLECLLSTTTGRPCVLASDACTIPLPQSLIEEEVFTDAASQREGGGRRSSEQFSPTQSSSSSFATRVATATQIRTVEPTPAVSFLRARIQLSIITQKALSVLYSPRTVSESWQSLQTLITDLVNELDGWAFTELRDRTSYSGGGPHSVRKREELMLKYQYNSTKILITRPCLSRNKQNTDSKSMMLEQSTAALCIQAAKAITSLLPDEHDPTLIYHTGPWWCIVHHIMQAIAVFLLELSSHQPNVDESRSDISRYLITLVIWLRSMQPINAIAAKAYKVLHKLSEIGEPTFPQECAAIFDQRALGKQIVPIVQQPPTAHMMQQRHQYNAPSQPGPAPHPARHATQQQQHPPYFTTFVPNMTYDLADYTANPQLYGYPFQTSFDESNSIGALDHSWWSYSHDEEPLPDYSQYQDDKRSDLG